VPTRTCILAAALLLAALGVGPTFAIDGIVSSRTYRPEIVGRVGVVAAGRHFAAEAGMRMLARGGNAVDAGIAATFAAAVTEISHFGMGGEVPIILYLADRKDTVVVNGQGTAPAAATAEAFKSSSRSNWQASQIAIILFAVVALGLPFAAGYFVASVLASVP